jgi:uncharacterized membrane protein
MVGRIFLLLSVVLASLAAGVFADDDTSGNIRVEVTKLENSLSYAVLAVIGVVVVTAVILSVVLIMRSRQAASRQQHASSPSRSAVELNLKPVGAAEPKIEGYYDGVFQRHLPKVDIVDEKASPAAVASAMKPEKNGNDVDRYLKEDERIVINVLRMKHDSCTQATLRVVTDFSKARLSRILSELEERGIIYKEQQGRKNLITLKTSL